MKRSSAGDFMAGGQQRRGGGRGGHNGSRGAHATHNNDTARSCVYCGFKIANQTKHKQYVCPNADCGRELPIRKGMELVKHGWGRCYECDSFIRDDFLYCQLCSMETLEGTRQKRLSVAKEQEAYFRNKASSKSAELMKLGNQCGAGYQGELGRQGGMANQAWIGIQNGNGQVGVKQNGMGMISGMDGNAMGIQGSIGQVGIGMRNQVGFGQARMDSMGWIGQAGIVSYGGMGQLGIGVNGGTGQIGMGSQGVAGIQTGIGSEGEAGEDETCKEKGGQELGTVEGKFKKMRVAEKPDIDLMCDVSDGESELLQDQD